MSLGGVPKKRAMGEIKIPLVRENIFCSDASDDGGDPAGRILALHGDHLLRINAELEEALSSRVSLIEDIGNHTLLGHGKRLRPLLFVLCCHLCGCRRKDVYSLSTIFEYIHTASLLHDDVLDDAKIRRKKPSANNVWGNHAAVLEGDFLYSKSFSIAVGCGNLAFLETLTRTTTQMAEGQILELIHTDDWDTSEADYMEIISAKTAVLISAACAGAAIIAGAAARAVDSLREFGFKLGVAFQLMDDILDYTSSEKVFGKPVGKDIREGKITLPLIHTLSRLGGSEKRRLKGPFENGKTIEKDYEKVIALVRKEGALEEIRARAASYVEQAAACLGRFPESPVKESLLNLSRYIVERNY